MKNSINIIALVAIFIASIFVESELMDYIPDESTPWLIVTTIVTIVAGYFRHYLSMWVRWLIFVAVSLTSILAFGDLYNICVCSMMMCIFSLTVAVRRMVMQYLGIDRVADTSVMRILYDYMEESLVPMAGRINRLLRRECAKEMVPMAHSISIMTFSLVMFYMMADSSKFPMEDWGYYLYIGLIVAIFIVYVGKYAWKSGELLTGLLAALMMALWGILYLFAGALMALLSLVAISFIITAIFNLLDKLFGKNE